MVARGREEVNREAASEKVSDGHKNPTASVSQCQIGEQRTHKQKAVYNYSRDARLFTRRVNKTQSVSRSSRSRCLFKDHILDVFHVSLGLFTFNFESSTRLDMKIAPTARRV